MTRHQSLEGGSTRITPRPVDLLLFACVAILGLAFGSACDQGPRSIDPNASPAGSVGRDEAGRAAPSAQTLAANAAVLEQLPFESRIDFENARRGFMAAREEPRILRTDGGVVWDLDEYDFQEGAAPGSVNPCALAPGPAQPQPRALRGGAGHLPGARLRPREHDPRAGDTGWIVIDPLTTFETATAAMDLVREHLGERPVEALIYTHSHIDHFGGARGVLSEPTSSAACRSSRPRASSRRPSARTCWPASP